MCFSLYTYVVAYRYNNVRKYRTTDLITDVVSNEKIPKRVVSRRNDDSFASRASTAFPVILYRTAIDRGLMIVIIATYRSPV